MAACPSFRKVSHFSWQAPTLQGDTPRMMTPAPIQHTFAQNARTYHVLSVEGLVFGATTALFDVADAGARESESGRRNRSWSESGVTQAGPRTGR
jgi:hypothetical protein